MADIYQSSLEHRFTLIMTEILKDLDAGGILNGLTVNRGTDLESLAEQAIINWAVARKSDASTRRPLTNLQHLLSEYCALADHLEGKVTSSASCSPSRGGQIGNG